MATSKKPTKEEALEAATAWLALEAKRLDAKRVVDAIAREQKPHHAVCAARLGEREREKLSPTVQLAKKHSGPRVEWKDVVIELAGAEFAVERQKQGKMTETVVIEQVG